MFDELDDLLTDNFALEIPEEHKTEKLAEGERRVVSILFADIQGFTNLSEKLDSEEVKAILDKLLKLFTLCIENQGGYVDKYEGDLVMALFGAKIVSEKDTERAIHSAFEMLQKLKHFNSVLKQIPKIKDLEINLGIRIGINTGLVTTGKIGKEREGDFTVYGDAVNLASRMESNAPINSIMITEETKKLVEDWFVFEEVGEIEVKGKSKPINVFLVKSTKEKQLPKWLSSKRTVFIGREEEMRFLENAYQTVFKNLQEQQKGEEKPFVVGVKGEAGLGKSRFVYEFLKLKLEDKPYKNLSIKGFCSNVSQNPYGLFLTIIRNYFKITLLNTKEIIQEKLEIGFLELEEFLELENDVKNLRDSLPILGFLLGLTYKDKRLELKGKDLQIHVQIAICYFIEAITYRANKLGFPFLIVLEDLHWIEESSRSTLLFLLRVLNLKEKRENKPLNQLLFIWLYRPSFEVSKDLKVDSNFSEIEIQPLNKSNSLELITKIFGEVTLSKKVQENLLEKSAGNPFYIEEWVGFVTSKGLIKDGKFEAENEELSIPNSLNSLILSRIDNLSKDLKLLLQKASVIGKEFSFHILDEVEKRFTQEFEVSNKLSLLEQESLIESLRSEFYVFNHVTTQEVAYNSLLLTNRKTLHRIIGETIESIFSEILDSFYYELAFHYERAEIKEKAIFYLEKVGNQSKANYENERALELFDRLLTNLAGLKKFENLKADTLLKKGSVLKLIGKFKEAEEIYKDALILSHELKDDDKISNCLEHIGNIYYDKGDYEKAMEFLEKSLKIKKEIDDKSGTSSVFNKIGLVCYDKGNYEKAVNFFEKSLKISKEIGDKLSLSNALNNIGLVYYDNGNYEKAVEFFEQSLEISEKNEDKLGFSNALNNIGLVYYDKGNYEKAMELLEKSLKINEELGNKLGLSNSIVNIGLIYYRKGDSEKSVEFFEKSLKIKEELGYKSGSSEPLNNVKGVYQQINNQKKIKNIN